MYSTNDVEPQPADAAMKLCLETHYEYVQLLDIVTWSQFIQAYIQASIS